MPNASFDVSYSILAIFGGYFYTFFLVELTLFYVSGAQRHRTVHGLEELLALDLALLNIWFTPLFRYGSDQVGVRRSHAQQLYATGELDFLSAEELDFLSVFIRGIGDARRFGGRSRTRTAQDAFDTAWEQNHRALTPGEIARAAELVNRMIEHGGFLSPYMMEDFNSLLSAPVIYAHTSTNLYFIGTPDHGFTFRSTTNERYPWIHIIPHDVPIEQRDNWDGLMVFCSSGCGGRLPCVNDGIQQFYLPLTETGVFLGIFGIETRFISIVEDSDAVPSLHN